MRQWSALWASGLVGLAFACALACVGDAPVVSVPDASTKDQAAPPTDAGSDSPTDASGPPTDASDAASWTPAALDSAGQLALWLEGSSENLTMSGGTIAIWKDKSQNHNDATNSMGGPVADSTGVGGHPAVHFIDTLLRIADAASLQFGHDQFFVAAVVKATADLQVYFEKDKLCLTGGGSFYCEGLAIGVANTPTDAGTQTAPFLKVSTNTNGRVDWVGKAFDDGAFHLAATRRNDGFNWTLGVDSMSQSGGTGEYDVSEPGLVAAVGCNVLSTGFASSCDVEIAELLVVHDGTSARTGVVADADVKSVNDYLKAKYSLP